MAFQPDESEGPIRGLAYSDSGRRGDGWRRLASAQSDQRGGHTGAVQGSVDPKGLAELPRAIREAFGPAAAAAGNGLPHFDPHSTEQDRSTDSGRTGHQVRTPVNAVRSVDIPVAWRRVESLVSGMAPTLEGVGSRIAEAEVGFRFCHNALNNPMRRLRYDNRANQLPSDLVSWAIEEARR